MKTLSITHFEQLIIEENEILMKVYPAIREFIPQEKQRLQEIRTLLDGKLLIIPDYNFVEMFYRL